MKEIVLDREVGDWFHLLAKTVSVCDPVLPKGQSDLNAHGVCLIARVFG